MSKVTIYSPPSAAQVKNCTADFDLRRAPVPIHLVQFDKTIPILAVALYKGGTAYKLPEDAEANVRMGKRNNLYVYNPVLGCNEGRTLVYVRKPRQSGIGGDADHYGASDSHGVRPFFCIC